MLEHWLVRCAAFKSLTGNALKLLIALTNRYNGHNNGGISLSVREAAAEVRCSQNHAVKLFRELQDKGFVVVVERGAFSLKSRHASTWRLTWLPMRRQDDPKLMHEGSKEFLRWLEPAAVRAHRK